MLVRRTPLRANVRPRHRNSPRPAEKSATGFLQWLRGRECACQGMNPDCGGKMQAAHVDYAAKSSDEAKGMGTKVADKWSIPLSANCHRLQHSKGWPWFDMNILGAAGRGAGLAESYWHLWPGRAKWEAANEA